MTLIRALTASGLVGGLTTAGEAWLIGCRARTVKAYGTLLMLKLTLEDDHCQPLPFIARAAKLDNACRGEVMDPGH
jgi:hypothetical protein